MAKSFFKTSGKKKEEKTEHFQLIPESRTAYEGHDAILKCHLSPATSAVGMTIRWFKESQCIYLYKAGQVIEGEHYEGRLSLTNQELERGHVSLTLRGFSDDGDDDYGYYICQVVHGDQKEEAAVPLCTWFDISAGIEGKAKQYLKKETEEQKQSRSESARQLEARLEMIQLKEKELLEEFEELEEHLEGKDEELMKMKELKYVNTENTQLAQDRCGQLETEVETLRIRLSAQQTEMKRGLPDVLFKHLKQLNKDELNDFIWYLTRGEDELPEITRGDLPEHSPVCDVVDKIWQTHADGVSVTCRILRDIGRKDLSTTLAKHIV